MIHGQKYIKNTYTYVIGYFKSKAAKATVCI